MIMHFYQPQKILFAFDQASSETKNNAYSITSTINCPCPDVTTLHGVPHHLPLYSGCPDMRHAHQKQLFNKNHKSLQDCTNAAMLVERAQSLFGGILHGDKKTIYRFVEISTDIINELVPTYDKVQVIDE